MVYFISETVDRLDLSGFIDATREMGVATDRMIHG
jgi:hypothetical protein